MKFSPDDVEYPRILYRRSSSFFDGPLPIAWLAEMPERMQSGENSIFLPVGNDAAAQEDVVALNALDDVINFWSLSLGLAEHYINAVGAAGQSDGGRIIVPRKGIEQDQVELLSGLTKEIAHRFGLGRGR